MKLTTSLPHYFTLAMVLTSISLIGVGSPLVVEAQQAPPTPRKIAAELSTILSPNGATTLAFTLFNNQDKPVKAYPLGIIPSCMVVTFPDGKTKEIWGVRDDIEIIDIKGHGSFTWKVILSENVGKYGFFYKQTGVYHVKWKVKGVDFDEVESNEILVNNEAADPKGATKNEE